MTNSFKRLIISVVLILLISINAIRAFKTPESKAAPVIDKSPLEQLNNLDPAEVQQELKKAGAHDIAKTEEEIASQTGLSPEEILEKVNNEETNYASIVSANDIFISGDSIMEALETYRIISSDSILAGVSKSLYWLDEQLPNIYAKKPAILCLGFGINQVDLYDYMVTNYINQYTPIIEKLKENLPNTRIVVLGINQVSAAKKASRFYLLDDYNAAMEKMCKEQGVEFFDPTGLIRDESWYGSDGIHPIKDFYTQIYLPELLSYLNVPIE